MAGIVGLARLRRSEEKEITENSMGGRIYGVRVVCGRVVDPDLGWGVSLVF